MKILTVIGARPQFIKAAVVSRALKNRYSLKEVLVHTGQHFDSNMSDVFFKEMDIPLPDHRLNINSLTHGKMTGRMLEDLEDLMLKEKPDAVLVYGDTNSTLAGALAASKLHIPVAHVEAGLRSFNMKMPEEINRILTDRISTWLFAPTKTAVDNLVNEGYNSFESGVYLTGDVMFDAVLHYKKMLQEKKSNIEIPANKFILTTLHREENITNKERFSKIIKILNRINNSINVIMPIHPGTVKRLKDIDVQPEFKLIEPVGYFDMLRLLNGCEYVVTDSGGLQKEAYFFKKYCITLRDQTEWIELVENNVNFICGVEDDKVNNALQKIIHPFPDFNNLYGDGKSGEKIAEILEHAIK